MNFWHDFSTLLHDPAHWAFELFLMALFDGLIGAVAYPFLKRHWQHHLDRDIRERANQQEQHFRLIINGPCGGGGK